MLPACTKLRLLLFSHLRLRQANYLTSTRALRCCSTATPEVFSQDRVLADGTFVPAGSVPSKAGQALDPTLRVPKHFVTQPQTADRRSGAGSSAGTAEQQANAEHGLGDSDKQPLGDRNAVSLAAKRRSPAIPPTAPWIDPISDLHLEQLVEFLHSHRNMAVVTGAGVSTESNIPDYRGPSGAYSTGFKPMTHQQFVSSEKSRARYWARSFAGWHEYCDVKPNDAHTGMARLQRAGWLKQIITQNVDRLHQKGGAQDVLELHGTTHEVICLQCGDRTDRYDFQDLLAAANPDASAAVKQLKKKGRDDRGAAARMAKIGSDERAAAAAKAGAAVRRPDGDVQWPVRRPDGDVELRDAGYGFFVPPCGKCGGPLKPDVVFFGDGVPAWRAQRALEISGQLCDAMLVVGSSLQVYSAFRLAKACTSRGAPLGIINSGATRADDSASLKVAGLAGEVMSRLAAHPALQVPPV